MSLAEPPARYLTPADVAQRLAVSRSMVYMLIKRRDLEATFIGRLPRISESALAGFLAHAQGPRRAAGVTGAEAVQ
jgi:excisionase family DNA binding protein